jgi:hypothetical protein
MWKMLVQIKSAFKGLLGKIESAAKELNEWFLHYLTRLFQLYGL